MKKNIKNNQYRKNPKGDYEVKILIRGIRCKVKIINVSFNEYMVEVAANKNLNEEFLNYVAYYMQQEGFYDEAQKHNLFWQNSI